MPGTINHVCDAVLWIDGTDYAGHLTNISLEAIEFNKTEEERLGMIGTPKLFTAFDPIIVGCTFDSLLPEWASVFANGLEGYNMTVRGSISVHGPLGLEDERPLLIEMTSISDQHAMGEFEQKNTAQYEVSMNCTYIHQMVDGASILEVDIYNYIYRVNGTNLVQARAANLGIG